MRYRVILNIVGKILILVAICLVFPLIVSVIYQEALINKLSFLITMGILITLGILLNAFKAKEVKMRARDGFVIVSLSWIVMSALGCLPFVISKNIPNYFDALFEMTSGFTTTGASVVTDLSKLSNSMLFWRAFSHWLGGMGVLVLILAFIPESSDGSTVHILRAESTGPQVGKLVSKMRVGSRILYLIYFVLTFLEFIMLLLGPDESIGVFEAIVLSFSTAGTGGFAVLGDSAMSYSSYTQYVLATFMFIFAVNFTLYFMVVIGKGKDAIKSEELRWYGAIAFLGILMLIINTYKLYPTFEETFRHAYFQVASIMSTTGFSSVDFAATWPSDALWIIIILMFIGGMAGSTGGGLKVSRVGILIKNALHHIKKMINPRRSEVVKFEGNILDDEVVQSVGNMFIFYMLIIAFGVFIISELNSDVSILANFSAVLTCLSNVGPGLEKVGTLGDFSFYTNFSKVIFSLLMIAGRLEIYPLIILFSKTTWRKY